MFNSDPSFSISAGDVLALASLLSFSRISTVWFCVCFFFWWSGHYDAETFSKVFNLMLYYLFNEKQVEVISAVHAET